MRKNSGYTMVELLAVVAILVTISGIITAILYSTLRGSSKAKIMTEVSQNGSYTMSVISDIISNSRSVTQVGTVILPDNAQDCTTKLTGSSIKLRRLDGGITTLTCTNVNGVLSVASQSASQTVPLTNTSQVEAVTASCTFSCEQSSNDPYAIPLIGVSFQLKNKGTKVNELTSAGTFKTSVSLNNYSP